MSKIREALEALVRQIEISGAVDDHGHDLRNLRALHDARAALASEEESGWRPIETAPRDRNILLYGPSSDGPRVTEGYWYEPEHGEYLGDCGGECHCPEYEDAPPPYWSSMDGGFTEEHPPTRWQPLPSPPAVPDEKP